MNLKLDESSLRLRISKVELLRLLEEGRLSQRVHLGPQLALEFGVRVGAPSAALGLQATVDGWFLVADRRELEALLSRPPSKDLGLYGEHRVGEKVSGLALELDVRSLKAKPTGA